MKLTRTCILSLVAVLSLTGCNKMTGGGWLIDVDGDRVSFGFNARATEEPTSQCQLPFDTPCVAAKGVFNLIDHGDVSGQRLHVRGNLTGTYTGQAPFDCEPEAETPCGAQFEGTATVNGVPHTLSVRVTDNGEGSGIVGDFVSIFIVPIGGGELINYIGTVQGGNLQVHMD